MAVINIVNSIVIKELLRKRVFLINKRLHCGLLANTLDIPLQSSGDKNQTFIIGHNCENLIYKRRFNSKTINDSSCWGNNKNIWFSLLSAAGVSLFTGCVIYKYLSKPKRVYCESNLAPTENVPKHRTVLTTLPTYNMDEIVKHNNVETGIWVTYGIGVYDVTKFVPEHPGSNNIMLGAGGAIDPFWHIYQQHNTPEILQLLETFRIGNLNPEDDVGTKDLHDPWSNEPKRHALLRPASQKPFNAEPPPEILTESFLTPNEFFYVRNHLPVPDIDITTYELEIEDVSQEPSKAVSFNFDNLKKLPKHSVTAAVMCGGNRRSDMHKVKPVKGLFWGPAAVGNATWSGPKLCDLLTEMGVQSDEERHVIFEGLDEDVTATPYAASIPLAKAMDPRGDVILAYEMNGKPLNRDHGYPIRVIVPGVVGARNVKWLGRIIISSAESDSHWQKNDYKGFSPSTDWDTVDFSKSPAIQNMPVTSAICNPQSGQTVTLNNNGTVTVKGYAWSGGGNKIVRVDVTADGGKSWHVATLEEENGTSKPTGRNWAWMLWTANIPINDCDKGNEVEICSKAVDSNYNVQPETFENTWNLRGVLSHAYSRIQIKIGDKKKLQD